MLFFVVRPSPPSFFPPLLVACLSLVKGLENAERGPNFYQTLGLRRGSSAIEIKRAYRQLSLELHPDKNPSQDAADRFSKMSAALEVCERERGGGGAIECCGCWCRHPRTNPRTHGAAWRGISIFVV